jgi:hypothetical protein
MSGAVHFYSDRQHHTLLPVSRLSTTSES